MNIKQREKCVERSWSFTRFFSVISFCLSSVKPLISYSDAVGRLGIIAIEGKLVADALEVTILTSYLSRTNFLFDERQIHASFAQEIGERMYYFIR